MKVKLSHPNPPLSVILYRRIEVTPEKALKSTKLGVLNMPLVEIGSVGQCVKGKNIN